MSGNPPVDVQKYGQSIWIDNIRRKLLADGTYARLIADYGVVGVTSNPTIFQKAIGGSDDYDEQMRGLLNHETEAVYEALAISDIQQAADMFRPIYDQTSGRDGYVSLEVSPLLANNSAKTASEARRLYDLVGRPNVMIKIPATPAGIPAIEETIASGVNVNVTLIFSVQNYIEVAEAYIRGLERRLAAGEKVDNIASVASFFLSRIDSMIDQMLTNNIRASQGRDLDRVSANSALLGKAAIANAKLAYKRFLEIFEGERFAKLRDAGAMVQRPLWASTSTKNPAYPDTMYIDSLIGAHTVNTVPPETLEAFKDHGTVGNTLPEGFDEAAVVLEKLAEVGVDIDNITRRLQDDGVEAFIDSYEKLLAQIEAKIIILGTGIIQQQKVALGLYSEAVQTRLKELDKEMVNARIWSKDGSVWKDHGPTMVKIVNRLGWLDFNETIDLDRLKALQAAAKDGPFRHVVLLGMGGSSLAPEVLAQTFGPQAGFPNLLVLDSTVPERVLEIERAVDVSKTLFIVASKSGSTIETDCFFRYFYEKTGRNGQQFVAITDEGSDLAKLATESGFRDLFLNPADIGGRYSALSYFGMVPAALIGLDLDRLWSGALDMKRACSGNIMSELSPGAFLGAVMGALAQQGRDKLCVFTSPSIAAFGSWVEQLVAESTGKEGTGVLPVVGASVGKPHDYVSDRNFIYLKVDNDPGNPELDESVRALREAGHPRVTLMMRDQYALAGEFFRWEYATAIAGYILGINPFDELNVTESKQNTARLLDEHLAKGALPSTEPVMTRSGVRLYMGGHTLAGITEICKAHGFNRDDLVQVLAAQIIGTRAGDYFALLAYLPQDAAIQAKLEDIRRLLRHTTKRAATIGFGPRYLHSTGQLHKGGPNNGIFIQLTHTPREDAPIPGKPYSFATLNAAQAAGDLEALNTHGRRSLRLHFDGDISAGLDVLLAALEYAEHRRA
jgi:transaldolase/glucose-6-phosphate isomerase